LASIQAKIRLTIAILLSANDIDYHW